MRRTKNSLDADHVTETRDDGVAAAHLRSKIIAGKRQEVGFNDRQSRIIRNPFRKSTGRPHDGAHADAAPQQLRKNAPPGAACASDEKNRLSCGHLESPLTLTGLTSTASSGTRSSLKQSRKYMPKGTMKSEKWPL
jgi:hypothetical protein